jgi:hypothetical protein
MALLACCGLYVLASAGNTQELAPVVEAEESVYTYEPADNGAGPLWCYGSTCLVRIGADVFVSGLETLPGIKPLNNVRWALYKRTEQGWTVQQKDPDGRTREPCPLVGFPNGNLFLSANPTLTPPNTYNGPARPQVLRFNATAPTASPATLEPIWEGTPEFTEHSYRGLCADASRRELLLFNIEGHHGYYWSFLDRNGKWSARGQFSFPMGVEYEKPEPIRLAYPQMALSNRAAHVMAISDIIEPVKEWREFKRKLTGREWDYEFRRLFYTWTPDITKTAFAPAIEIASREKTAGHITNLDLWLDKKGRAHLLWLEQSVWYPQMRDKFFPGVPLTTSLEYAIVEKGKVALRSTLAKGGEGASSETPGYARFQATPDGRLFVFAYFSGRDATSRSLSENRLLEILSDGRVGKSARVALKHPFTSFMTATERGGSPPSNTLEVLGDAAGRPGLSYACIRLR